MARLVFDIETSALPLEQFDDAQQEYLFRDCLKMADEAAQAAWLTDGATFVSYDSPRSIQAKGAYVRAKGLMGMMTWEYGGDADGALLRAMRESMP